MGRGLLAASAVVVLTLACMSPSDAFDGFLWVEGVRGVSVSMDPRHKDWIDIEAVNFGLQNSVMSPGYPPGGPGGMSPGGPGGAAGRPLFQPVMITKFVDGTSPHLARFCAEGRPIPRVTIDLTVPSHGGPITILRVELENVAIASYAVDSSTPTPASPSQPGSGLRVTDSKPTERVSFKFSRIKWTSSAIGPRGEPLPPVTTGYDLEQNKAF